MRTHHNDAMEPGVQQKRARTQETIAHATRALLHDRLRAMIRLRVVRGRGQYVVFNGKRMVPYKGVTKTVWYLCKQYEAHGARDAAARTCVAERLAAGLPGPVDETAPPRTWSKTYLHDAARCTRRGGLRHGKHVHEHLGVFIHLWHAYLSGDTDVHPREAWPVHVRRKYKRPPDVCAATLIQLLEEERWIPLATEYHVFDASGATRLATSVDLFVFCANTSEIALVELKTGYSDGYTRAERACAVFPGRRRGEMHTLYLSTYTRHLLQTGLALELFRRGWSVPIDKAFIVRVSAHGRRTQIYDVTALARLWGRRAYEALRLLRVHA